MATGMRSGSFTSRARSSGFFARCHNDEPMADHVVSIPAMSVRIIVPKMCSGANFCPITSTFKR